MADQYARDTKAPQQALDLKRKLIGRMVFAGLLIVALLVTLAVFDYLSVSNEPVPSAPQFTERVPVAKKEITQALKPAEPPPEETQAAEPESSAVPVDKSMPSAEPPPRPEVLAQPVLPKNQTRSTVPLATTHPMTTLTPNAAPPQPVAEPAPPPRLFSGYALQAGVFSDTRRAEELHAKLTLNGIPSTLEARVQVGPFKTRQDAETAREKIKTLGIDAVLLMPKSAVRR
jgi:DedD protein